MVSSLKLSLLYIECKEYLGPAPLNYDLYCELANWRSAWVWRTVGSRGNRLR